MSAPMRQEIADVKTKIASMDGRFDRIDARFARVDERFDQIDARFAGVDARFDRMESVMRVMAAAIVRIEAAQGEMKRHMLEKFVTRDEFHNRMDAFSAKLDDSRFRWAVHADTLMKHDERLARLESRPNP